MKKYLSVLLMLVLLISLFPVTAMAHDCLDMAYYPDSPTTHYEQCTGCGKKYFTPCTWDDNNECVYCGQHNCRGANQLAYIPSAEGEATHTVVCKVCDDKTIATEDCQYEWVEADGKYWKECKLCSAAVTEKKDLPTLTINAPDAVCVLQDCEFTVTAPEGVTIGKEFGYDTGMMGSSADLTLDDDGVGHGVMRAEWYGLQADSFKLMAEGTTADGKPLTAEKTVQIQRNHIFVDGVCGCGTKQHYIVTYDPGEYGTGSIEAGVKTYDVPFTLSSETFERKDYVQTGWTDANGWMYFALGDTYYADEDVTLYPMWDEIITLTVPYTTTVALGDVGVPGEKTFTLALIGDSAPDKDKSNVTVSGSVTTNGKGSYNGTLTITGPEETLWYMLSEGAFVQQVNAGEEGWSYDDTVWGLLLPQIAAYSTADSADYTVLVLPTVCEETDDGVHYDIDWEAIDWDAVQSEEMRFENVYTAHVYELKYDATSHWDECGCGDMQNKEAHQYGEWTVTKEATETAAGEKEHTCTVCGYQEKAEIAKLTETDPAQTGDSRNLALWFALLAVSTVGLVVTGVYSKRRRSSRAK